LRAARIATSTRSRFARRQAVGEDEDKVDNGDNQDKVHRGDKVHSNDRRGARSA
jgi:hypothetical protein